MTRSASLTLKLIAFFKSAVSHLQCKSAVTEPSAVYNLAVA